MLAERGRLVFTVLAVPILISALPRSNNHATPLIATASEPRIDCVREISGAEPLLRPGVVTLLGELHGTDQSPAFIGALLCLAARQGVPAVVAVELPRELTSLLSSAATSPSRLTALSALASAPRWTRAPRDGRTSQAMLSLIQRVHELIAQGGQIGILGFSVDAPTGQARDRAMAGVLDSVVRANPAAAVLVLTGNLHSRVSVGAEFDAAYQPMGNLLRAMLGPTHRLYGLDASFPGGHAWMCLSSAPCQSHAVRGTVLAGPSEVSLRTDGSPGPYDGVYGVDSLTASPPADVFDSGAFVTMLGRDTISVETFAYFGELVAGEVLQRAPRLLRTAHVIRLLADGGVASIAYERAPDQDAGPRGFRRAAMQFGADSAVSTITTDSSTRRLVGHGARFPAIGGALLEQELVFRYLRRSHRDSADIPLLGLGQAEPWPTSIGLFGRDSARVWNGGSAQFFEVDSTGRILGMNGSQTTVKIVARRRPLADLESLARGFAADRDGMGLRGGLSPHDSTSATIGGATVVVRYGRPSLRGRDAWVGGVLGDSLWRLGANEATTLETSGAIVLGGRRLPRGSYSLWVAAHPDEKVFDLIVNSQHGQWGTEHHAERDIFQVPLRIGTLPTATQRLTILLDSSERPARLRIQWGLRELSLPVKVAPMP